MRPRAVALATFALCGTSANAHARLEGLGARLEAGVEYDTNPTRSETFEGLPAARPQNPSAALRLALSADFNRWVLERWSLSLGGAVAARRLVQPEAQGEDLVVSEARAGFHRLIGTSWLLGAQGAFYDVGQRADSLEDARDFRSLAPGLRLSGPLGTGRLALGAGWRWFHFKPADGLDFHGPTVSLGYRRTPVFPADEGAEWEYGLGGALEDRSFSSLACAVADCGSAGPSSRRDRFFAFDADVTRTGDQLLGAGVALQNNRSNSFGQSLWRLAAHARLVWLLPLDVSLAARAELVLTRYDDAVAIGHDGNTGAFLTIEEEGRSSARINLSHPLGPPGALGHAIDVGVRYTWYGEAPGTGPVHFSRQLFLAYLALSFGR